MGAGREGNLNSPSLSGQDIVQLRLKLEKPQESEDNKNRSITVVSDKHFMCVQDIRGISYGGDEG